MAWERPVAHAWLFPLCFRKVHISCPHGIISEQDILHTMLKKNGYHKTMLTQADESKASSPLYAQGIASIFLGLKVILTGNRWLQVPSFDDTEKYQM